MQKQNPRHISTDGEWLAHRYDAVADSYHLRYLDRESHNAATFITDEYLGAETNPIVISRSDAIYTIAREVPLHFIVHSAFCASTMMAKGFDLPGISMGLKEPVVLNDIVGFRRRGASPAAVAERLDHSLRMLSRPFGTDLAVIAKPSNVFNALAPAALTIRPASKAILLYAPLPVFLLSVARKGLWCRLWCRELLEGLIADGIVDLGFDNIDYFRQSDLQIAAVGWLAQQALFHKIARQFGPERIATLDSERLTDKPAAAIINAAKHFGLEIDVAAAEHHAAFAIHSKSGKAFRAADRRAEYDFAQQAYGDEIEKVLIWAQAVAQCAQITMSLPFELKF